MGNEWAHFEAINGLVLNQRGLVPSLLSSRLRFAQLAFERRARHAEFPRGAAFVAADLL
jgi:hypothetical protein